MKKKNLLITLSIIGVIVAVIGVSYAAWLLTYQQTGINKVATSCFSLSLTNEKNDINLTDAYPILDEEGKKLTPYSFTITNTCNLFASYTVNLEVLENSTLPIEYVKVMVNKEQMKTLNQYETTTTTITGAKNSKILASGSLGAGDSEEYSIRLWMDENVMIDSPNSMNQLFTSKIVISAQVSNYSPVEQGYTTLADAMLANEYQTTPEIARQKIASKQAADFTKTAPLIDWQENHASTTSTTTATMPHPELVGNTDPKYAKLTAENILPRIGTSYTFDKETGKYTLENTQYLDPTTINYNGEISYYFSDASFTTTSSDVIQTSSNYFNRTRIYKITGATATESTTIGSGGTVIKTKVYKITGYLYNQGELESDKSEKGLYQTTENGEPIYYYRGSVSNNYVKFGDFYWRIVRTNGDGSIRLLYAGSTPNATGNNLNMNLTDSTLGYTNQTTSAFNSTRNDPGYVGYMYGSTLGSTYEQTNANENDSTIKKYLDSWYKQNIVDQNLENYIADAGFCNDRRLASTTNYPTNGNGVQIDSTTYYAGNERYSKTKAPKLECINSNDLFTTSSNAIGNKALTYPIGLITVDELMLSGFADGYLNRLAYTYSSSNYWTMSPSISHVDATAHELRLSLEGFVNQWNWVSDRYGVRGVINLKSNVEISGGIGTSNDPYIIKTA